MVHQRKIAEKKGRMAEWLACMLLRLKGYRIITKRFRTYVGEIDIIARRGRCIFFIEVKYRTHMTQAIQSLTPSQMKRIQRAALVFETFYPHYTVFDKQVDVILCSRYKMPRHLQNIVGPSW